MTMATTEEKQECVTTDFDPIKTLRETVQSQGQRITVLENDLRMLVNEVRGTGSFAPTAIAERKRQIYLKSQTK